MVEDQITIQVNPLPVVALGDDAIICIGDSVIIDAGTGFSSYNWSTGETVSTISAKVTGEYWVEVANEFGCTDRDTMSVTVNEYPGKPVILDGPATVDNYMSPTSNYSCDETPNALNFSWVITPPEAGTINGSGNSAEVTWVSGYTGSAQVTVIAQNDCGTGEVSDAFSTEVYSSQGIDQNNLSKMLIYPNPGQGQFAVRLPVASDTRAELKVTDASGALVYHNSEVMATAGGQIDINLSNLPDGVYNLNVITKTKTFQGKLIIKHN
jgi:hypothetical protein